MGAKANFHHFRVKTCKAWLSCCPAASSRCHCSHPLLGPEIRYSGLRGAARCRKALSTGNTGCLLTWGRSCTLVTLSQIEHKRLLSAWTRSGASVICHCKSTLSFTSQRKGLCPQYSATCCSHSWQRGCTSVSFVIISPMFQGFMVPHLREE